MKREAIQKLELKNIGFSYENGANVFSGVNHEFKPLEILFIQGPMGAGKNTLIKLLLGLLTPSEGQYLVNGISVNEFSYAEFDHIRLNIGYSFDVGGLISNQSLYENMKLVLDYHDYLEHDQRRDYILNLLSHFELKDQMHLRPSAVSSSVKKAASVVRAFALNPEMIILDNPTQGMSVELIPSLIKLINKHKSNYGLKYIIISSDDRALINQLGGTVLHVTQAGLMKESA